MQKNYLLQITLSIIYDIVLLTEKVRQKKAIIIKG